MQSLHGLVPLGHDADQIAHQCFQPYTLRRVEALQGDEGADLHLIFRNGAGFIHAQHIHTSQSLNALHVMHQHLPGGKAQNADHQRHAGEQIQPLGNHAQHRGHHGQNAVPEGGPGEHILLDEQENTNGHNENANHAHQPIQGAQHFRTLLGIHGLGFQGQLGDVGLGAHPLQPGGALAGNQKAAGHEEVSQSLFQLVGLASEQSLVDQHLAVQNNGVGADLVACPEEHDVVQHQLLRGNFLNLPLPDDPSPGRVQHGELIQGVLGPNLLDNADEKICHHQRQEGQVPQRAGGEYQHP